MKYTKSFVSSSGKEISLLVFEASVSPKLTIIESHGGLVGSKEREAEAFIDLINFCALKNINLIFVDLSTNGTMKNQPLEMLRYSDRVKDVESVMDFVSDTYKSKILLLGNSLGGFVSLNAALASPDVIALVLNCPAVKAHECIRQQIDSNEFNNWEKSNAATWSKVSFPYLFYEDVQSLDCMKILPQLHMPILWFHGTADETVPISQAYAARIIAPQIELIEIKDGGHRFADKINKEVYEQKIEKFILDQLGK